MGGWLAAMVTMAVAGRETVNQLSAFQVMELRALIGLVLLSPLILKNGKYTKKFTLTDQFQKLPVSLMNLLIKSVLSCFINGL